MRGYITLKTNKKILMIDLGKEYGGAEKMLQNLISQIESTNIYLAINEKSDFNNYGARKLNRNIRKELDRKLIDKIFI